MNELFGFAFMLCMASIPITMILMRKNRNEFGKKSKNLLALNPANLIFFPKHLTIRGNMYRKLNILAWIAGPILFLLSSVNL